MHCNIDIHFLGIHKGVMHYLHAITSCMCDVMSRISVLYAHSLLTKHAISFSAVHNMLLPHHTGLSAKPVDEDYCVNIKIL